MKTRYDWTYYRQRYVGGFESLAELANIPNAPSLITLKNRSRKESWTEQRKQFRNQVETKVNQSDASLQAMGRIQRMLDAAEVLTRHLKLAQALQSIAAQALQEKMITAADLTPRDLLAWISTGVQIERLALDMATAKLNIDVDFSTLSDDQLQRIAAGELITDVLGRNSLN